MSGQKISAHDRLYLASSLGYAKQLTGSYQIGFLIFAALALLAGGNKEARAAEEPVLNL